MHFKGDYINYDVLPIFSDKGDPDEMPNHVAFYLGPHCLPKFRLATFRLRSKIVAASVHFNGEDKM